MSKNIIERTDACHVITLQANPTEDIPEGAAVVLVDDWTVGNLPDQNTFAQGVALAPHSSGVYDCIPVLVPGPVIHVVAGSGIAYGELVNGDASDLGTWIPDSDNPAGYSLETVDDGDEFDMVYIGEQN